MNIFFLSMPLMHAIPIDNGNWHIEFILTNYLINHKISASWNHQNHAYVKKRLPAISKRMTGSRTDGKANRLGRGD